MCVDGGVGVAGAVTDSCDSYIILSSQEHAFREAGVHGGGGGGTEAAPHFFICMLHIPDKCRMCRIINPGGVTLL